MDELGWKAVQLLRRLSALSTIIESPGRIIFSRGGSMPCFGRGGFLSDVLRFGFRKIDSEMNKFTNVLHY